MDASKGAPEGTGEGIAVRIRCDECSTPVAELHGTVLLIRSRHHRGRHMTAIELRELLKKGGR